MHNDYTIPFTLWSGVIAPTPSQLRKLDQTASESVNGDEGGTWNPETPIVIGGEGLDLPGNALIEGGVETGKKAASGGALILGDSGDVDNPNWPLYLTARERTIVIPLHNVNKNIDYEHSGDLNPGEVFVSGVARIPLPMYRIPPGAIVSLAVLKFRVGFFAPIYPSGLGFTDVPPPTSLPQFSIIGIDNQPPFQQRVAMAGIPNWQVSHQYYADSETINTLGRVRKTPSAGNVYFECTHTGISGGTQPAGFATASPGDTITGDGSVNWICRDASNVVDPSNVYTRMSIPTTGAQYFANGQVQSITMSPTTGRVIDGAKSYWLEIKDYAGTANKYHSLSLTFLTSDMRPGL